MEFLPHNTTEDEPVMPTLTEGEIGSVLVSSRRRLYPGLALDEACPIFTYDGRTSRSRIRIMGMGEDPISATDAQVQQALFNQRARDFLKVVDDAQKPPRSS